MNLLPADDNCRFIPPLPKDTPPRPPPPPSTESDSEGGESRSQGNGSPLSTVSAVLYVGINRGWNAKLTNQVLLVYFINLPI